MLNLEELALQLSVIRAESTYIDGNQLYDEVLNYMPRLNRFIFNIHTHIINSCVGIDLPYNNDIRNSFINRGFQSIDTCADERLINNRGNCHVYSLPYQFSEFLFMSSCFQGGKFNKVRMLLMLDRRPFEHELFKIISQDFPFLQKLIIWNSEPEQNKQHHSSTTPSYICIEYETLKSVTNNFTNDATRAICTEIKSRITSDTFVRLENFDSYFSSHEILVLRKPFK
ncbi:unnamed protein product [Rotaria sp. Silwood2]|nr:unnamed protein product [Rotaria sp. Silwood2]CAF4476360.1 unnamed protein product [Rotaria sp. Silwood2]